MRSGLPAVAAGSFWRSEPDAELRGFAKTALPACTKPSFSLAKSSRLKNTSPRISTCSGQSLPESCCGTDLMVRTFAVTSSPVIPSPRVAADTKRPCSYLRLIANPSILGSQRKGPGPTLSAQARSSESSKALSRLSIGSRCSTGANRLDA